MKHYELYKCRFIILFIVFVLSFKYINFYNFYSYASFIYGFCMISSFAYMIVIIRRFKANDWLKNDFYKLSFYLLSGAVAFVLYDIFLCFVRFLFVFDYMIFIYDIKNYIFLVFLIYFAKMSYKRIKWNYIWLNVLMY